MPRVSFHGVPISWSWDGPPPDPLAGILGSLDSMDPGEMLSIGVEIILRSAPNGAPSRPDAGGYLPILDLDVFHVYREGSALDGRDPSAAPVPFLLRDQASRIRVPLDGSPIEAAIAPAGLEITPGSTAAMLHLAIMMALRREGLFHLHAAGLVHPSGAGILIAGGSGAGKTTTAIALIEAGYSYLGDDALFLRSSSGEGRAAVDVLAFPREFHAGPATLSAFPRLAPLARARAAFLLKLAIDPGEAFPGRALHESKLPAVLLFPRVADAASTEMVPLSKADALGLLIASSVAILIEGMPHPAENIDLLRKAVEAAKGFEIRLGRDALEAPARVLSALVERALAAA